MVRWFPLKLLLALSTLVAHATKGDFYIILNGKNNADKLSKEELKNIYLGYQKQWDNGSRIFPSILKFDSDTAKEFLGDILDFEPDRYTYYWRQKLFSGSGHPPRQFSNNRAIFSYIKDKDRAIGIVSQPPTDDQLKEYDLKIIRLQQ